MAIADTNPAATDPQTLLASLGVAGKLVCPFCGAVTDKHETACRRCTMENTPLTRQATRARIGPWYVMQSRNPSAPGMRFNTLVALIRRGQIAPRSVIRGPTTHQLWRFAIRVKGVSREFGYCYSCCSEIASSATVCPRCSKSQELPPNPDALLELEQQATKPVYVEVKPKPAGEAENGKADDAPTGAKAPGEVIHAASSDGASAGAATETAEESASADGNSSGKSNGDSAHSQAPSRIAAPSPTTTMSLVAGLPSPEFAGQELQSRPRHQQLERILSPRELATAFSLQFNPGSDQIFSPPPVPGLDRRAKAALVIVLVLIGLAVVASLVPPIRTPALVWMRKTYHRLVSATQSSAPPAVLDQPIQINPSDRPDWAMQPPTTSTPIETPAGRSPANRNPGNARTPSPAEETAPSVPGSQARPPSFLEKSNGETANGPNANGAAAAGASATIPPANPEMDTLAMNLRRSGLDAESRRDYTTAVSFYEQIEKLPREHWPSDTDQLLQAAKKRATAAKTH